MENDVVLCCLFTCLNLSVVEFNKNKDRERENM